MLSDCKKVRRSGYMPDGSYILDDLEASVDYNPFKVIKERIREADGKFEVYDDDGNVAEVFDNMPEAIGRALDEYYGRQVINLVDPTEQER